MDFGIPFDKSQISDLRSQNHNLNLKSNIRYRAYKYSLAIIQLVYSLPEKRIFWIISDQLLRSATSVGANLTEAKSSSSKKEFIRYYEIALKSTNESKYWICLLKDSNLIESNKLITILQETTEISKMIGSSLLTMKGKKRL